MENEAPIAIFYFSNQTKPHWSNLQELLNSEILLPQNMPQRAFFGFPDNTEHFEIINHLHIIFKCYLLKFVNTSQRSLERLRKNVKICNIEKQICFNNSKNEKQSFLKMAYTRKPIKITKTYSKRCLDRGIKVNI